MQQACTKYKAGLGNWKTLRLVHAAYSLDGTATNRAGIPSCVKLPGAEAARAHMTARNYDHVFLALEAHVTLGGSARCRHGRKNGRLLSSTSHGLAKRFSRLALG